MPPAKFVFNDDGRRGTATDSLISGGCLISGSSVTSSVLFSNVRVHSYGEIESSVIMPNVVIERNVKLKRCIVDKGAVIPEGMMIGFDLEEDKKSFVVSDSGITLVTSEMLGQRTHRIR